MPAGPVPNPFPFARFSKLKAANKMKWDWGGSPFAGGVPPMMAGKGTTPGGPVPAFGVAPMMAPGGLAKEALDFAKHAPANGNGALNPFPAMGGMGAPLAPDDSEEQLLDPLRTHVHVARRSSIANPPAACNGNLSAAPLLVCDVVPVHRSDMAAQAFSPWPSEALEYHYIITLWLQSSIEQYHSHDYCGVLRCQEGELLPEPVEQRRLEVRIPYSLGKANFIVAEAIRGNLEPQLRER